MAWVILIASGMLEAVWATALGKSNNFRNPLPSIVFVLALTASMAGLAWAMLSIPVGTAYAVWVGIGAVLTAAYAMAFGGEKATVAKVVLLMGIIGCVVGLKVVA
ncbi:multidrug efflux SMR transporter [Arthrobacter sp. Sa2BUA2]|uniref:Multidrug efflux SMR transporter n=1 Tax=Arthrobacter pullicola TaxID=2762224 RepID=A0ABR8YEY0_9MICC|nr:multidrug efflux SMR transporter [Arthrobacter pullicola]MBD8042698.1 multidrug efflux SMR transporter [Arthrobacter pullicola]